MIKRILVGLGDVEYSAAATRRAIELASAHGASLTGVTLFDVHRLSYTGPIPIGGGAAAHDLREHRLKTANQIIEEVVENFRTAASEVNIPYDIFVEDGDPLTCMLSNARYHDVMVCGLKTLFEHGVVDDPADTLVQLVQEGVRPILATSLDVSPVNRILIAYSGSMESAKTMKRFAQMAIWPLEHLDIKIVTYQSDANKANALLDGAREYFEAHGAKPHLEHRDGSPKDDVLKHADEWQADVLVVGNSAKQYLRRRIFGDTALNIMQKSQRSLFLSQ